MTAAAPPPPPRTRSSLLDVAQRHGALPALADATRPSRSNSDLAAADAFQATLRRFGSAIEDCAVFGFPAAGSTMLAAAIVPAASAHPCRTLRRRMLDRPGASKTPRQIVIVNTLPRPPAGKLRHNDLPEMIAVADPCILPAAAANRTPHAITGITP